MTTVAAESPLQAFQWEPQPRAAALVAELTRDFVARCPLAATIEHRMLADAGVRFGDCVDTIAPPRSSDLRDRLNAVGFVFEERGPTGEIFHHPGGVFPRVALHDDNMSRLWLKVERVVDFLSAWRIDPSVTIEGGPLAPMRQARAASDGLAELWVVERHGWPSMRSPDWSAGQAMRVLKHQEAFQRRRRDFGDDEAAGFAHAHELIDAAIADLGVDYACDLFFTAERDYWQRRNRAGQIQKARQDRLGLGWANHDHHTYRSSRRHFAAMIGVFEKLGFHCRERFYAGAESGWGAQVLEQPTAGITIFADVDLSPQELFEDFSHQGLEPRKELGTVGLWCALHGEAFLQAGMHHLECQFGFDALKTQLESQGDVKVMKPFTSFSYLRQAFTEGERWPVQPERIDRLLSRGQITAEQAENFRKNGAVGSHLENLERNDGFKGFNQTGESEIIARMDPRKHS